MQNPKSDRNLVLFGRVTIPEWLEFSILGIVVFGGVLRIAADYFGWRSPLVSVFYACTVILLLYPFGWLVVRIGGASLATMTNLMIIPMTGVLAAMPITVGFPDHFLGGRELGLLALACGLISYFVVKSAQRGAMLATSQTS